MRTIHKWRWSLKSFCNEKITKSWNISDKPFKSPIASRGLALFMCKVLCLEAMHENCVPLNTGIASMQGDALTVRDIRELRRILLRWCILMRWLYDCLWTGIFFCLHLHSKCICAHFVSFYLFFFDKHILLSYLTSNAYTVSKVKT